MSTEDGVDNRLMWFTSSHSNGAGGECVECALAGDGVLVRDSKIAGSHMIAASSDAWHSFTQAVKRLGARY
ncbi:DUF397 domain-containing protein [Streptomyces sp. NPDC029044]|uniref:DUF397 domain-containing protein n=1 Tax=Streptomyces sp. NPDC029044 TaxID=3157198 RepID=UPI00340E31D0